jgi:hypothetical protein
MQERHNTWLFRVIHYRNLEHILDQGICCKGAGFDDPDYVHIGSSEIVSRRDTVEVKCYPGTCVSQYVPFYFGIRTPMLYKIKTGHGVQQISQHEIIYLCCRFQEITGSGRQCCFTNGNAATSITKFYNEEEGHEKLDWKSIHSVDWSDNNADGDHDRMRKKHSEFLVKDHVPVEFIRTIVVLTEEKKRWAEQIIHEKGQQINVHLDNEYKFYFR